MAPIVELARNGWEIVLVHGNGPQVGDENWRRRATSPVPLGVVEFPIVRRLLEQGTIVIAAGGGGPPVYDDPLLGLEGLDAVVDKDRVAAILATQLEAEVLMILTNVD